MKFKEKVKKVLKELELPGESVEIEPSGGLSVVAVVVSDAFETMDEGERQHLVWKKLIEKLDPYEQTLVEFVHTMAPSEMEPADDEA